VHHVAQSSHSIDFDRELCFRCICGFLISYGFCKCLFGAMLARTYVVSAVSYCKHMYKHKGCIFAAGKHTL